MHQITSRSTPLCQHPEPILVPAILSIAKAGTHSARLQETAISLLSRLCSRPFQCPHAMPTPPQTSLRRLTTARVAFLLGMWLLSTAIRIITPASMTNSSHMMYHVLGPPAQLQRWPGVTATTQTDPSRKTTHQTLAASLHHQHQQQQLLGRHLLPSRAQTVLQVTCCPPTTIKQSSGTIACCNAFRKARSRQPRQHHTRVCQLRADRQMLPCKALIALPAMLSPPI